MKNKLQFRMQSNFRGYSESLCCKPHRRYYKRLISYNYVPVNPWNAALPADAPAPNMAAPPSRFGIDFKNWPCCDPALAEVLLDLDKEKLTYLWMVFVSGMVRVVSVLVCIFEDLLIFVAQIRMILRRLFGLFLS